MLVGWFMSDVGGLTNVGGVVCPMSAGDTATADQSAAGTRQLRRGSPAGSHQCAEEAPAQLSEAGPLQRTVAEGHSRKNWRGQQIDCLHTHAEGSWHAGD